MITSVAPEGKSNRSIYHILFMKFMASVFIPSVPLSVMLAVFRIFGMSYYSNDLAQVILCGWALMISYTFVVALKTPYVQLLGESES